MLVLPLKSFESYWEEKPKNLAKEVIINNLSDSWRIHHPAGHALDMTLFKTQNTLVEMDIIILLSKFYLSDT
jgi:hypothetical protein